MRIMRSLRIGDERWKIYLQEDFEQEILNLEVLEILKKQEILNLENKHAFFSSEHLKDNFRPVQKLMGRVVRQPKFIWIKTFSLGSSNSFESNRLTIVL